MVTKLNAWFYALKGNGNGVFGDTAINISSGGGGESGVGLARQNIRFGSMRLASAPAAATQPLILNEGLLSIAGAKNNTAIGAVRLKEAPAAANPLKIREGGLLSILGASGTQAGIMSAAHFAKLADLALIKSVTSGYGLSLDTAKGALAMAAVPAETSLRSFGYNANTGGSELVKSLGKYIYNDKSGWTLFNTQCMFDYSEAYDLTVSIDFPKPCTGFIGFYSGDSGGDFGCGIDAAGNTFGGRGEAWGSELVIRHQMHPGQRGDVEFTRSSGALSILIRNTCGFTTIEFKGILP
jgi:hypothetical protein